MNLVNSLAYCTNLVSSGGIPDAVGNVVHLFFIIIQIVAPVLLILWGAMDFVKGVVAQDEDKIKAGQKKFIQRIIAAVIVFLIVTIVQLVINVVGSVGGEGNDSENVWTCAKSLINGKAT